MSAAWQRGPDHVSPPLGEVHVWRADLGDPGPREVRAAGRRVLRLVLARYLEDSAGTPEVELVTGVNGKPALAGPRPPLRFNLSHSDGMALVAVAGEREVGVDVERADPGRDVVRLAEVGLDAEAAAAVRSAPPGARAAAFYAAWVRREAVVKCFGVGLGATVPSRPVSVTELDAPDGYAAALAVDCPAALPVRQFAWPAPA
jgi:4'-phosphopantetheinyl transferase